MPAAYLTAADAELRLARYNITATPSLAELEVASDDLDLMGGFVGEKLVETQHREFPRDVDVQDDPAGAVPPRVLDWVALKAYRYTLDDDTNHSSERIDSINVAYNTRSGKVSREKRLMRNLLRPYRAYSVPLV